VELPRRIEKVTGRLFEGEEAVFHVIERIVAPLGLRITVLRAMVGYPMKEFIQAWRRKAR
jgi:hypothetical protein